MKSFIINMPTKEPSEQFEPIWKQPKWLTAIIGLITALLTIPDVIGNYFAKQQDVELAKQETQAKIIANNRAKQEQEFNIINNIIAKQGTERIFVLRYLAATFDDEEAKEWAREEVSRLDQFALVKRQFLTTQKQLDEMNQQYSSLHQNNNSETEIQMLMEAILTKTTELEQLRQNIGLPESVLPKSIQDSSIQLKTTHEQVKNVISEWNKITTIKEANNILLNESYIRDLLAEYELHYRQDWSIRLKASYLYHLAALQIIYTDVTRQPDEIFIAKKNNQKIANLIKPTSNLTKKDIDYFSDIGMKTRVERQALNISIFTYLATGNERYKQDATKQLQELGGCQYIYDKGYKHVDIHKVLEC